MNARHTYPFSFITFYGGLLPVAHDDKRTIQQNTAQSFRCVICGKEGRGQIQQQTCGRVNGRLSACQLELARRKRRVKENDTTRWRRRCREARTEFADAAFEFITRHMMGRRSAESGNLTPLQERFLHAYRKYKPYYTETHRKPSGSHPEGASNIPSEL